MILPPVLEDCLTSLGLTLGNGVKLLVGVSGIWGDTRIMTERGTEACSCDLDREGGRRTFHSPGFRGNLDLSHPVSRYRRRLLQTLPMMQKITDLQKCKIISIKRCIT